MNKAQWNAIIIIEKLKLDFI